MQDVGQGKALVVRVVVSVCLGLRSVQILSRFSESLHLHYLTFHSEKGGKFSNLFGFLH